MDIYEFERRIVDDDYKRVRYDEVAGHAVSTTWLGVDYGLSVLRDGAPPVIFETMIFRGVDTEPFEEDLDEYCERYSTEAAAIEGHKRAVAGVERAAGVIDTTGHVAGEVAALEAPKGD